MFDLLPLLAAVERGRMALPLQLSGVASTIQVAGSHFSHALKESLEKLGVLQLGRMALPLQLSGVACTLEVRSSLRQKYVRILQRHESSFDPC